MAVLEVWFALVMRVTALHCCTARRPLWPKLLRILGPWHWMRRFSTHKTTTSAPPRRTQIVWADLPADTARTPGLEDTARSSSKLVHPLVSTPRRSAMSTGSLHGTQGSSDTLPSGTGARFGRAVIILSGVAALAASLITIVYVASLGAHAVILTYAGSSVWLQS